MKKYIILPVLCAAGIFAAGCKKEEDVHTDPAERSVQTQYVMQSGDTQVTGEVTEIIGNEVVLALGKISEKDPVSDISDDANNINNKQPDGGEISPFQKSGIPDNKNSEEETFRFKGDNDAARPERQGGRNRASSEIEKSGETASYIIPVGMTVNGANGRNNDYSSVSAGMVLRLTLNSDGYVVAAEIV